MIVQIRGWSVDTNALSHLGYDHTTGQLLVYLETGRQIRIDMALAEAEDYNRQIQSAWNEELK